ncbi:acetyl-CoA hydrolase/transferase family protein [Halobacteriovorax sp. ZH4_bin.1]|uniref:acetyl-CoA hydrolase/transferase family protein n=1 Tax=unclassified Halobacteriovorax TaxID=2639665 RepID=UPI00371B9502
MKIVSNAAEALSIVYSNSNIFIHGGDSTPQALIDGLLENAHKLKDVTLTHLHTHGDAKYANEEYCKNFKIINLFVGGNVRKHIDYQRVDYLPCFLSEIPNLFRSGRIPLDFALIHVSPPDQHGHCTLGTSVDVAKAAVSNAKVVIAQINPNMPRVHGDGFIHVNDIDYAIEIDDKIVGHQEVCLSEEDLKIGQLTSTLIEDGSTLQMGIGSIPDAVLASLKNHKNLGIHTEMWSNGALDLIKSGAVNNSLKNVHRGKTVSAFIVGGQDVHDFIDDNPSVIQLEADYVNNPSIIKRNPKVCAINSAVEIDLTGQVCADSIGHHIISGVGGQMDFMRGASLSEGGKPIIVINSRSAKGFPKIVPTLRSGAGVVTTRSHMHYVVTEYGIADLYGKSLNQRAQELIRIAHPDDRENLEKMWHETHCRR